ncbi:hypothetical protein IEQ34_019599 [Dendrobium chrysotoxum]|uniref:Uncharacterized protein n=1 Tax=Dendrobium chrysotoxum TaxID=161865 RepID=A0AAV7G936_DENCH|nr:hypothetical protein IEQ34_019599 [Dendrobium chrysotoxum]
MKHMCSITNICNAGISNEITTKVSAEDYVGDDVNADNIFTVLLGDKKSVSGGSVKTMVAQEFYVIYLESCESGSIFEGLLPEDISIYAITTSNVTIQTSKSLSLSVVFNIYNVLSKAYIFYFLTFTGQVKTWTYIYNTYDQGSHVIQYGEFGINEEIGSNPTNYNSTFIEEHNSLMFTPSIMKQCDADLIYY